MVRSVIKEGGTGSVAQEIIAARQEKEEEKGRQGGQVTQKEENIEQIHVEIYKESITDQLRLGK